ncbi:transposase [Sorangium sp. So ce1151]
MKILRAIVAGERDPDALAAHHDVRCKASIATIREALTGNYRPEHVFALRQTIELYDTYQNKLLDCDAEIERSVRALPKDDEGASPAPRPRSRKAQKNEPSFEIRAVLHALLGVDLTQIHGLGPYSALRIVAECGTDMTRWPTSKHFTSWLTLAPGSKISGGKVLSSRTRRSTNRAATLLRLAAVSVGRTSTALGAFFRRLAARTGKAKAVTATALKVELVEQERYPTRAAAIASIGDYMENFYNLKRRHSRLDYMSPIEFELRTYVTAFAAW